MSNSTTAEKTTTPKSKSSSKIDIKSTTGVSPLKIWANPAKNYSRFLADSQGISQPDNFHLKLAVDMSERGSREAVKVMHLEEDALGRVLDLVTGFNRHTSATMIVKGFWYKLDPVKMQPVYCDPKDEGAIFIKNEEFTLKIALFIGNEDERYRENIGENAFRRELTGMDYAHQVRYCKDILNLSVGDTARRIGIDASYVSQVEKLLALPKDIQGFLASGECQTSERALMKLVELPPDERLPFINQIMGGAKITLDDLKKYIINRKDILAERNGTATDSDADGEGTEAEGSSTPVATTHKAQQMSAKLQREYYESRTGPAEFVATSAYCAFMDKRLKGQMTDKQHDIAFEKFASTSAKAMVEYLVAAGKLDPINDKDFKAMWKAVSKGEVPATA